MKIYVGHSNNFDYKKELYEPLRSSSLNNEHLFILPHEKNDKPFSSKEFFQKDCDLMIAEVSYPTTGLGIEIGWADAYDLPIVSISKRGVKTSRSVKTLAADFLEYDTPEELISGIEKILNKFKTK